MQLLRQTCCRAAPNVTKVLQGREPYRLMVRRMYVDLAVFLALLGLLITACAVAVLRHWRHQPFRWPFL